MNIVVNNLGPIRQAKFDFDKRISIFCGPNNTGKTYLSYILYAFARRRVFLSEDSLTDGQLRDFVVNRSLALPMDMDKIYEIMLERMANISDDLSTVFGIPDSLVKKLFPDFRIEIDMDKDTYVSSLKEREIKFEIYFKNRPLVTVRKQSGETTLIFENKRGNIDSDDLDMIKQELLSQVYYRLIVSPIYDSHFFPVERSTLYTYYKDILSNRNLAFDVPGYTPRYPLAIDHTLSAANRVGEVALEKAYYAPLADEIEKEILSGRLSLTDDGDMKFVSNRAPRKEVPLYLSASVTKAVSGLVFCLRHIAGVNDMIFIDEPEVNCHPDVQILLARIFAKMVNAGLRLVISTHSDYIIREINNLIMLSGASEEMGQQLQEWGYTPDMALAPQTVGAYLFAYGNNNRVNVKPIEVTDSGFEVRTIDATISRLNEISEALYYELRYGHKK